MKRKRYKNKNYSGQNERKQELLLLGLLCEQRVTVFVSDSSIQTIQLCAASKTMDGWFLVLNSYVCFSLCRNKMLLTRSEEKFVFLNELYMSFSNAKIQYKQKNIYNIKTEIITWKLYKN